MLGQSNVKVLMGIGHPIHSHDVNRCMGTGCFANDTLQKKKFSRFSLSPPERRLSAFVQISALFQIYIADMSRHLHHLTKCPFEVKKERAERTVFKAQKSSILECVYC